MKTLSIEKMEKIEGGCIEYALAAAEFTYAAMSAGDPDQAQQYWIVAGAFTMMWQNCYAQQ